MRLGLCKLGLNGKKSVLYEFSREFLGYLCRILMIFSILQTCINYMAFFLQLIDVVLF